VQEGDHGSGIGEHQEIGIADAHFALDLRPEVLEKVRLRDEPGGLIARSAEQQGLACAMETIRELLERVGFPRSRSVLRESDRFA
jgi:hypothetical protein